MTVLFKGHRILIAEDEPLIALDVAQAVEAAGAEAVVVHSLKHALAIARVEPLSAAVIDIQLQADEASPLCAFLQWRNVPFVIYTGAVDLSDFRFKASVISKPAAPDVIVNALAVVATPKAPRPPRPANATLDERVARTVLSSPIFEEARSVHLITGSPEHRRPLARGAPVIRATAELYPWLSRRVLGYF